MGNSLLLRASSCLALIAIFGCSSGGSSQPDAAAGDVPVAPTDHPTTIDAPPQDAATRCVSDRECSAGGMVCDTGRGQCVECNAATDCTGGRMCLGNRCVMTTPCTSSRMCPGQVCAMLLGYCVDCVTDVDCTGGQVCRSNVCVAPPRPCRSSRECSDIGLVCATVRGYCVECVADTDCPMDRYCDAMLHCAARVCVANSTRCVNTSRMSTCNAIGSAESESACAAGQTCREGHCQAQVCAPGQMSCDPTTMTRRVCNADGGGYAAMPCADTETCRDGACVMRSCTPGTATCASITERRVCSADGLSTSVVSCASGEGCRDGACVMRSCTPGTATCASSTVRSVCNTDGFGTTTTPCGASQRCASGACVDLACTPGSSMCLDARTVRVCNADGTSAMNITCPTSSTCTGSMCSGWVCTPGMATCPSGATARTICNADGLATRSEPCAAPVNANSPRCGAGDACTFTCNTGYGDCNMIAADGCEVNGLTDPMNCGGCGRACAARANSAVSCTSGVCDYRCNAGFGDCDGNAANGCEASLTSSTSCGRCGNACTAGQSCLSGTCASGPPSYMLTTPPAGVMFTDVCMSSGVMHILVSSDDQIQHLPMPFAFPFWGAPLAAGQMIHVSSNGFVSFDVGTYGGPSTIPSTTGANGQIAAWSADLVTGTDGVCVATLDAAPSRRHVIEWSNVTYYNNSPPGRISVEIVLYEGSGAIDILTGNDTVPAATTATVGVENLAGTAAILGCSSPLYCTNAPNQRRRFVPTP